MKFFIGSEDPRAKVRASKDEILNYYPTKNFKITVDKKKVLESGTVAAADSSKIVSSIEWTISQNYLMKNDIMMIDLLANNNWKRPIYFATTVGTENFLNLDDYFQLEGLAYRLVPVKLNKREESFRGTVATDIMYDNVMNKFQWGNMKDPRVYLDENNLRMTTNMRINTIRLTEVLLDEGKMDSARAVLDKCMTEMPESNVPYNIFMTRVAEQYFRISGNLSDSAHISNSDMELDKRKECRDKGMMIVKRLARINEDNMDYYISLKGTDYYKLVESDINQSMYILQSLPSMTREAGLNQLSDSLAKGFMKYRTETGLYE
jgi:mRNA-degrading endonuclease HigB of HigAB toxin-antitoxin module